MEHGAQPPEGIEVVVGSGTHGDAALHLWRNLEVEGPFLGGRGQPFGAPVSTGDLEAATDRWPLFAPRAVSAGFRSVQAVPLRLRGTILGAFNLFLTDPGGIDPAAEAVVQAMADVATIGLLQQRELDRAHTVEGQLQRALQTRIGIEQAKGIISERMGIEMDAAFVLLRGYSRNHNRKLHDVARDVVNGVLTASDLT